MALVVEVFLTFVVVSDFDFDFVFVFVFVSFMLVLEVREELTEGVILAIVVWEGVTAVRVVLVLVLALIVTNVDVLDKEADSLVLALVVKIVDFLLLLRVEVEALCFTVLLVDAEFEMLDAVEDLGPTELVDETGYPWTEDEEEGRL